MRLMKESMAERELANYKRVWGVAGFDQDQAQEIINKIEKDYSSAIERKRPLETEFIDGVILRALIPNSCGFRCEKLFCNRRISQEEFNLIVSPCYFGEGKDIVWL